MRNKTQPTRLGIGAFALALMLGMVEQLSGTDAVLVPSLMESNQLRLALIGAAPNQAYDIVQSTEPANPFSWSRSVTGVPGRVVFDLPRPNHNSVFYRSIVQGGTVRDVPTDVSSNPTTLRLVLATNQNCFRVWTGEQDMAEPCFDLFVKTNGAAMPPVRLYRWQARIISAPPGSTIALGTTNGRVLSIVGGAVPGELETPTGVTNLAACDAAGPPLWSPTAPHVVLPGENMAFSIASPGRELPVFIAEYDGARWTPPRFVILETNAAVTIRVTYRHVALANYDGIPLQVVAPSNSVVGGTSQSMSLPYESGREWYCTNVASFLLAVSNAVAGEQIVLADGVYEIGHLMLRDDFAANIGAGYIGPEGITIRSASGLRDQCVITGEGTNGGWLIVAPGMKRPVCLRDVTFDFSNLTTGFWPYGGKWNLQNVRFTGRGPCDGDRAGNVNFRVVENDALQVEMLRVQCDNSEGRAMTFSGVQVFGTPNPGSRVRLIDCTGFTAGTNEVDKVLLAAFELPVEIYGGRFSDAEATLLDGSYGATVHCFWTTLFDGPRVARLRSVSMFGCDFTTRGSHIEPEANSYVLFSRLVATEFYPPSALIYTATDGHTISHNRFQGNAGRALWSFMGGARYEGNVLDGWNRGCFAGYYSSGSTNPVHFVGNTLIGCEHGLRDIEDSFSVLATNNAGAFNVESVSLVTDATNQFWGDFNVYDAPVGDGMARGPQDILGGDAQVDSRLRPMQGGNCDLNGAPSHHVGDADPWGQVLRHTTSASRGARSRPVPGGVVVPDVW